MANTYVAMSTITTTSSVSSISFTSIPQIYTDLLIKVSARTNAPYVNGSFYLEFNGSTSNRTAIRFYGAGSGSGSSDTNLQIEGNGTSSTTSSFGNAEIYIPNYASSGYKTMNIDHANETNAATAYVMMSGWLWSNTASITSVVLQADGGTTFSQNTSATLYGIKNS